LSQYYFLNDAKIKKDPTPSEQFQDGITLRKTSETSVDNPETCDRLKTQHKDNQSKNHNTETLQKTIIKT
jgi:hypothetical protein